jgi:hypothetical protein
MIGRAKGIYDSLKPRPLRIGTYDVVCQARGCRAKYSKQVKAGDNQDRVCGFCGKAATYYKVFTLKFKYCDCGCKSCVATVGDRSFRVYDSCLDSKDRVTLYNSHGPFGRAIGTFTSYSAAVDKANELAREIRKELRKALRA